MSGLIPQPFIDELLTRIDLVELIDSFVPLKKRGNNYIACCPFHSEKTPSFSVVSKKNFYHCFGCGVSGNAISFIISYLNQPFIEAIETLAARAGLVIPTTKESSKNQSKNLYQLLEKINRHYQHVLKTHGKEAINYLQHRGLTGEIARQFQLGYSPPSWNDLEAQFKADQKELIATGMLIKKENGKIYDRYRHRIMFPIRDRHGRIIGFGGRAIDKDQQPKYLNSPETAIFQKNRELYGLYQVLQQVDKPEQIIVVEGYLDVIALAQFGINNAVATLGTATSSYHIQLLSKHCQQIIFCFDGDNAGRQAAWRALENCLPELNSGLDVRFVFLPQGDDPDSLIRRDGKNNWTNLLSNALSLHNYFFNSLTAELDLSSLAGKSLLITKVKSYLTAMPNGPYKQLMLTDLSRITRIEIARLESMLHSKDEDPHFKQPNINRSPLRLAVALLIQNPQLINSLPPQLDFELFSDKEFAVLRQLIEKIKQKPNTNPAILIEAWRDSLYFDSLSKLACWHHQVPDEALEAEFKDIMLFLARQNIENKINFYLNKSRQEGLTDSEREQLQQMLKNRHQSIKNEEL